jgi:hypothetical protein
MGAEVIMPRHRNPPDGDGGRIIGRYGFVTSMVTKSYWQSRWYCRRQLATVRNTVAPHPTTR